MHATLTMDKPYKPFLDILGIISTAAPETGVSFDSGLQPVIVQSRNVFQLSSLANMSYLKEFIEENFSFIFFCF